MVKIKLEIQEGSKKASFSFEGKNFTELKEDIIRELNSYQPKESFEEHKPTFTPEFLPDWLLGYDIKNLSQKEKVMLILKHQHTGRWVQSQDLQKEYKEIFGEEIKLSSLSTYLARFHEEGALERQGSRAQREYRLPEGALQTGI